MNVRNEDLSLAYTDNQKAYEYYGQLKQDIQKAYKYDLYFGISCMVVGALLVIMFAWLAYRDRDTTTISSFMMSFIVPSWSYLLISFGAGGYYLRGAFIGKRMLSKITLMLNDMQNEESADNQESKKRSSYPSQPQTNSISSKNGQ